MAYFKADIVKQFRQSTRGNVAMMFAVTLSVLGTGVGAALTMADIGRANIELQKAVDAAALAAARTVEGEDGNTSVSMGDRRKAALQMFTDNAGPRYSGVTPTINVQKVGDDLTASVVAEYDVQNTFAAFLPSRMTRVRSQSNATSAEGGLFTDIYVLVDNSASMGIGQTSTERWKMLNDTDIKAAGMDACAVACHIPSEPGNNTYPYYQSKGVRMRIDAVTDALVDFMGDMKAQGSQTEKTRYNIRVTGDYENPSAFEDGDPYLETHDAAIAAAGLIELEARSGRAQTQIGRSLIWHDTEVPVSGQGTSESDRQSFVILMTDGVENTRPYSTGFQASVGSTYDPWSLFSFAKDNLAATDPARYATMSNYDVWNWALTQSVLTDNAYRLQTINPAICQPLKDKGVTVMVMNIEYGIPEFRAKTNGTFPRYDDLYPDGSRIVPPWDGDRDKTVVDLKPRILPALKACASEPELVFSVESESQMRLAFDRINKEITSRKSVRLTD